MAETLDVQNFITPNGIVRRGIKRQGALYEAIFYPGVFTDRDVRGEILKTMNQAQAMMEDRHRAKAEYLVARDKEKAAYATLVKLMGSSTVSGPGKQGSIDEIEQVYAADRGVMAAAEIYRYAMLATEKAKSLLDEVCARPIPHMEKLLADANGPVEMVGATHAIGIDGTTYTLAKGGVWVKDTKGH